MAYTLIDSFLDNKFNSGIVNYVFDLHSYEITKDKMVMSVGENENGLFIGKYNNHYVPLGKRQFKKIYKANDFIFMIIFKDDENNNLDYFVHKLSECYEEEIEKNDYKNNNLKFVNNFIKQKYFNDGNDYSNRLLTTEEIEERYFNIKSTTNKAKVLDIIIKNKINFETFNTARNENYNIEKYKNDLDYYNNCVMNKITKEEFNLLNEVIPNEFKL